MGALAARRRMRTVSWNSSGEALMIRSVLLACACLTLAGCVRDDVVVENAQLASARATAASVAAPGGPAQSPPPGAGLTSTARLAKAREIMMNKTTMAGATLLLASPASLNADCTPLGPVEAKVVTAPEHGKVRIAPGPAFPNYVPGDPPYACNAHRSPATIITYRAAPGFSGEDSTAVQIFFPDGDAPTVLFHIAVR
jgi:hypothetical protein